MHRLMTKKELIFVTVLTVISISALFVLNIGRNQNSARAQVTYDGKVVEAIELNEDGIYHIDALLPVTLKVSDGKICFINSVCPNHDCEGFGLLSSPPDTAICLPARVSVQIID